MDPRLFFTFLKAVAFIKRLIFPLLVIVLIVGFFYLKNSGKLAEIKNTFNVYSEKITKSVNNIKEVTKTE
jgi:hypothetical protein